MSIHLNKRPSVDNLGVKRWTYDLSAFFVLHVYLRPPMLIAGTASPYMLRVDHRGGEHVLTVYAIDRPQAERRARWLADIVADGRTFGGRAPE